MSKEKTFEEKVVWLSNYDGYNPFVETILHGPGQYELEINQDFEALFIDRKI